MAQQIHMFLLNYTVVILLVLLLNTTPNIYWRSNIHLGPNQNKSILSKLYNYENNDLLSYKWYESWTSNKYGERFPSHSLVLYGDFKKGKNIKKFSLKLR